MVVIDEEATVKRLVIGPDYWVLKPESTNRSHHPIVLDREAAIQGVVCRVLKQGAGILSYEDGEITQARE